LHLHGRFSQTQSGLNFEDHSYASDTIRQALEISPWKSRSVNYWQSHTHGLLLHHRHLSIDQLGKSDHVIYIIMYVTFTFATFMEK